MNGDEPAFPAHGWSSNPEVLERMKTQGGMTKREYFAAMAMQSILRNNPISGDWLAIAKDAVAAADAMIAELNHRKPAEPQQ